MFFVTIGTIALVVFAVVGIFYSLVVAAVVAQRIWQRHYHILAKRMLTKVRACSEERKSTGCRPGEPGEPGGIVIVDAYCSCIQLHQYFSTAVC